MSMAVNLPAEENAKPALHEKRFMAMIAKKIVPQLPATVTAFTVDDANQISYFRRHLRQSKKKHRKSPSGKSAATQSKKRKLKHLSEWANIKQKRFTKQNSRNYMIRARLFFPFYFILFFPPKTKTKPKNTKNNWSSSLASPVDSFNGQQETQKPQQGTCCIIEKA